jgi:hypothetical protein
LETGYGLAALWGQTLPAARDAGLFSLAHLPKNLYALLLATPQAYPSLQAPVLAFPYLYPSPWGMGLFFTTPAFLYLWRARLRERMVRGAWLATCLVLIPIVTYYGVGWMQFGYRYALDAYPFLFVLMARGLGPRVTRAALALIALSVLINIWGAWWQIIGFGLLSPELW